MKYRNQLLQFFQILLFSVCFFATATAKNSTITSVQSDSSEQSVVFPEIFIDEELATLTQEIDSDYPGDETVEIQIGRELQKIFGSEKEAPYQLELLKFQAFRRSGDKSLPGRSEDKAFCRLKVALIGSKGGFTEYEVLCSERLDRFENSFSASIYKAVEKTLYRLIEKIDADI